MKHIVIGTAGHIDHGKTLLTQALTGTDTDRLKEEKARGITIENGFAQLILPNGQPADIIDVPGHEKFVRNMIVGATGIDLALLVVAADDGFMPQTREHLDILNLLGVKNGLIVVTKTDLADEDWIEVVIEDIKDKVRGTFLENALVVPVSARTGAGIDELKTAIQEAVENTGEKDNNLPARMPVDRVFSVQGYGTVVTGTLTEGTVRRGDVLNLYPQNIPVKVRELQNHDSSAEELRAGMRSAINITGCEKDDISRGSVLAEPGTVTVTRRMDVSIKITEDSPFNIKNASRLHMFVGTKETVCKIRLLDADEVEPGYMGFAQLITDEPVCLRNGDRFILRFFSPVITVAGGTVLNAGASHRKRFSQPVLSQLNMLSSESLADRGAAYTEAAAINCMTPDELALAMNISLSHARELLEEIAGRGDAVYLEGCYAGMYFFKNITQKIIDLLKTCHTNYPLKFGMSIAELRKEAFGSGSEKGDRAALILNKMAEEGIIKISGDKAAMKDHEPQLTARQQELSEKFIDFYSAAGFEAPAADAAIEAVLGSQNNKKAGKNQGNSTGTKGGNEAGMVIQYLIETGRLVALTPHEAVTIEVYEKALETVRKLGRAQVSFTLADFRTALDFSRKYAQMFLEYWDKIGVTAREGDSRTII